MPTNKERILDYLRLIAPRRATNEEICSQTGIRPHQQVFQITQRLSNERAIRSILSGKEWEFWVEDKGAASTPVRSQSVTSGSTPSKTESPTARLAQEFESAARQRMSEYYGTELIAGEVGGVPKRFDLVSRDGTIVGDAKFYTMVQGQGLPPAKFSVIAEHVWLLEKTGSRVKFLIFGNDRRVPEQWLKRYSQLLDGVDFFFLATDGKLDRLR